MGKKKLVGKETLRLHFLILKEIVMFRAMVADRKFFTTMVVS